MPPAILSSNLISVSSLDVILTSAAATDPTYRFQLISTKLAILTNRPSQPKYRSFESELQILQCRLDLARASLELVVPNLKTAEAELGLVRSDCKGITKRMCRENRIRSDKAAVKSKTGAGGRVEKEREGSSGLVGLEGAGEPSRPAPTPISSDSNSTSTDTTPSTNSARSTGTPTSTSTSSKYGHRQEVIEAIRVEAVRLQGQVSEMKGIPDWKERLDSLASKYETE